MQHAFFPMRRILHDHVVAHARAPDAWSGACSLMRWRRGVPRSSQGFGDNMMCAFGVPGYMIQGTPAAGFSVIPVDFSVAPGMYTT